MADRLKADFGRSVRFATDITINEAAVHYLDYATQHYVKNGKITNQVRMIRPALRVAKERFGHLEAASFGPKALEEWLPARPSEASNCEPCQGNGKRGALGRRSRR